MRTIFVFAILISGIIAALTNRFAALLLYLWFALFRPQEWMWFDISTWRLSLLLGILLVGPSLASGILPNLTHPLSLGGVLFLICASLGQLNAFDPGVGWMWLDFFARLLIVSLLAVTLVNTPRRYILTLLVIASSFGFHAAKAGLAVVLGLGTVRFGEGAAGAFADNNGYAVGMAMIAPLLVACGQNFERLIVRLGFLAAGGLCVFGVIGTYSRGGFLAVTLGAFVFAVLQRRRVVAVLGLIVLSAPVVLFIQLTHGYSDRLQTITAYEEVRDTSAIGRLHFWNLAVRMAEDYPLGIGLFNYQAAYDTYDDSGGEFGRARSVHSSHFQVLAETGFPGLIVWVGLFSWAFWVAFRIRREAIRAETMAPEHRRLFVSTANALVASMVAFLVGGAFVAMALNDLTWMSFALVASLDRLFHQVHAEPVTEASAEASRSASGWAVGC